MTSEFPLLELIAYDDVCVLVCGPKKQTIRTALRT